MAAYETELMQPFGILVKSLEADQTIGSFSREQLYEWAKAHKLILFRGFRLFDKPEFALYGQQIGEPLQWVFGAINELKVKPEVKNYIYTDRAVPLHWDGAFVGKIPYLIFFQCLKAPKPEDHGGTVFSDTTKVLKKVGPEKMQEWQQVEITYKTEKVVHYGGKITQKLLAEHPVTHEPILRYAEPVYDLNPVELTIKGIPEGQKSAFEAEMEELLYDPEVCLVHRWQEGDIVIADNHALLHGREAFLNPHERHIQRINILHRPERMSQLTFLKRSLTIRRKEFFVAEIPIFLIPLLLAAHSWQVFTSPVLYLGLLAIILLFNIGDMINCLEDHKLDAVYKSHLSNAVYELGKKNIKWQIIFSGLAAWLLTIIIALWTKQYYLIPLTLVGTFIGLQYSMKPFHFKSRGLWQLLCLWGIIFSGPMVYTAIITNGWPTWPLLVLFAAYGFHQMGIIMLNTAEDYPEDIHAGLRTMIVALGLYRAMRFAWFLIFLSGLVMHYTFLVLFRQANLPLYLYPVLLIFTGSWLYILSGFRKINQKIAPKNEEEAAKELKANGMKVPEWLKLGAYSSLAVAAIIFAWRIF